MVMEGPLDQSPKSGLARGGGFFIAIFTLIGAIGGGLAFGQGSAGLLIGLALGIGVTIALWLMDRRRG
ncbi:MAG: hypothetical protein R3E02_01965 [Blastomonas sp.]